MSDVPEIIDGQYTSGTTTTLSVARSNVVNAQTSADIKPTLEKADVIGDISRYGTGKPRRILVRGKISSD